MKYLIVLTSIESSYLTLHCEVEGDFLPREGESLLVDARVFVQVRVHHDVNTNHETNNVGSRAVVSGEISHKDFEYLCETDYKNWRFRDTSNLQD